MKNTFEDIRARHDERMQESRTLGLKPDQRDQDIDWLLQEVADLDGALCAYERDE